MTEKNVLTEVKDRLIIARLNRPEALNALNDELMDELSAVVDKYESNENLKCLILTGSEKAFAAGADIKQMQPKSYMDVYKEDFITKNWERIARCRKPTIAAVSGYALGGGCELAMMCDFIVASDSAKFGQPEINLGISPGAGGTQRLTRFIGKSKSMDMCLTGRMMDSEEADSIGLVSRVFSTEGFIDKVIEVGEEVAEKSLIATMMIKEMVNRAYETTLSEGVRFERRLFHSMFATNDKSEGMAAFIEKRKPDFKDV
jgi:enoyl-CoA hydratase/carnithine racemase